MTKLLNPHPYVFCFGNWAGFSSFQELYDSDGGADTYMLFGNKMPFCQQS